MLSYPLAMEDPPLLYSPVNNRFCAFWQIN
jgi:hypothetical protein